MSSKTKRFKNAFVFGSCPVCRKELNEKNAYVLKKVSAITQYCVKCGFCSSSLLLSVSSANSNMTTSIGILTDVKKGDFALMKSSEQISVDDVLEIHKLLENYV